MRTAYAVGATRLSDGRTTSPKARLRWSERRTTTWTVRARRPQRATSILLPRRRPSATGTALAEPSCVPRSSDGAASQPATRRSRVDRLPDCTLLCAPHSIAASRLQRCIADDRRAPQRRRDSATHDPAPVARRAAQIARVLGALDDKIDSNRRLRRMLEQIAATAFRARFVDFVGVEELEDSELGPIPRGWRARASSPTSSRSTSRRPQSRKDRDPHYEMAAVDAWASRLADVTGGATSSSGTRSWPATDGVHRCPS